MTRDPATRAIRLRDYAPPAYLVDTVALDVDISRPWATVRAGLVMRRSPEGAGGPLVLDGAHLELLSVSPDGAPLDASSYTLQGGELRIAEVPEREDQQGESGQDAPRQGAEEGGPHEVSAR